MRLLALFFACYLTFLSCLTCTDEVPACKDQRQTTVAAAHTDCGTDVLGDWCSPLCQCHCCGGAVLLATSPLAIASSRPVGWAGSPRHGRLVVATPTRALGAVWQPPQG